MKKSKTNFIFEPKGHSYYLEKNGEKKRLTGVTTILNVIAKPALIQWSANMAVDYIIENILGLTSVDKKARDKTLLEARTAYAKKRDKAGEAGTDVHALIEQYIKHCIEFTEGDADELASVDKEQKQLNNFVKWSLDNKVKFLESEKKMYSEKHWIAGTCDFVCEIDKKRMVGDIKTSSGIYDRTPHFQTAGYRLMLEEMGEGSNVKDTFFARLVRKFKRVKIDKPIYHGSVIVNLKKDGTFTDADVHYSYDYKTDLKGFMACLELYRSLNTFKNGKNNYNKNNTTNKR